MSLSYNAGTVTNAQNTFYATSNGAVQGFAQDDPAVRFQLRSGIVSPAQSTALWGGMGVAVNLPTAAAEHDSFKAVLSLATSQANLMGFTVWNQSLATVLNPSAQNAVPLAAAGGGGSIPGGAMNFYLLGSNAQIWVQVSSTVAGLLKSGAYNQAVYWDYTNQVLLAAPGGTAIGVEVVDLVTNGNAAVVGAGGNSWVYNGFAALIKI
jgi:hypothetical protein